MLDRPIVKPRPVYLNLVRIRLPLPGIVSFLHRVSGALLVLAGIPLLLAVVGRGLRSPEAYADLQAMFAHPLARLVALGLVWACVQHFLSGLRHLLLDLHVGIDLASARKSSAFVFVAALVVTLAIGVRLW